MEKAFREEGCMVRCAEDLGGEGHNKTSGEGKLGKVGGLQGYLNMSFCIGESTVLTAPLLPPA